ncbi:helix-turn-helix domain-containing protein [Flammeovirga aprica]|uniref:Helix-turn-helix domain-containing protein n=1 Tax=Flammeovirga aprica JL-4 TaxID=694437 RepID=A0A7X9XD79_9BACT|nr:helix-turn-helix domain-containing protein [Flammeovirga aprica]NME72359.1 helix-turn-helix domain-containing protein [Flammeovirga aprica JL-4]
MKNLQLYQRKNIQRLIEEKMFSVKEIAEGLEVSPSTIYRELKRNTNPKTKKYNAEYAHKLFLARKKFVGSSKKNQFRHHPYRKNDYKLHTERRFLLWYSDRHYKAKLNSRIRFTFTSFLKEYAMRRGIKKITYHKDGELFNLLIEHIKLQKEYITASSPKYYWMRALIKNEITFTLWKNPLKEIEQKKCV